MSEFSGHRPYTKLLCTIGTLVRDTVSKFKQIWEEIGYDETEIQQRCQMVERHTKVLYEEMLEEAGSIRQQFIVTVERLLIEACELGKEVGFPHIKNFHSSRLKDAESFLQAKVEEYRVVKQQRMFRLAEYKKKDMALCKALGDLPRQGFANAVPTEQQLDEYEIYLSQKEEEKERLMCIYRETKIAIIPLIRELGTTPIMNFHKLVLGEESEFNPTKENMAMLKDYHQELENKVEETKILALELREKLSLLWERLQEDIHHRESFLGKHQGYSASTISGLKEELRRCEQLKQKNIKKFVGEIRKELEDWWDKCLKSEEERNRFSAYRSSMYTEDLLELHELEVKQLKNYYEYNIDILKLAVERQNLWDKMLKFEDRTLDPERLFKNRGGQLLREEQERKNIQKELPKVEKELLKYLEEYENKHGTPFYIEGEIFKDRIKQQWAHHKANKESEKLARKARAHLSRTESRVGTNLTATKRKHPPTPTPGRSTKRRHVSTSASTSKASRSNPAWKKEEKRIAKVRRKIIDRTVSASSMQTDNKTVSIYSTPSTSEELARPLRNLGSTTSVTNAEFKDDIQEINEQGACRSSVAAARSLRVHNINPLPTPKENVKSTPVKPPRKNIASHFPTPKTPTDPQKSRGKAKKSPQARGGTTTPRVTGARGRLPIII